MSPSAASSSSLCWCGLRSGRIDDSIPIQTPQMNGKRVEQQQQHTIVLMQHKGRKTYADFGSQREGLLHLVAAYENRLKQLNPHVPAIDYTVKVFKMDLLIIHSFIYSFMI